MENKKVNKDQKLTSLFETLQIMRVENNQEKILSDIKKLSTKKKDTTPVSPKRKESKTKLK